MYYYSLVCQLCGNSMCFSVIVKSAMAYKVMSCFLYALCSLSVIVKSAMAYKALFPVGSLQPLCDREVCHGIQGTTMFPVGALQPRPLSCTSELHAACFSYPLPDLNLSVPLPQLSLSSHVSLIQRPLRSSIPLTFSILLSSSAMGEST